MAQLRALIHVTEKLLYHISGTVSGVAAVYNRYSYLYEMREAVKRHDDFPDNILSESRSVCPQDQDLYVQKNGDPSLIWNHKNQKLCFVFG
jgi:hypothetical protein